jgi:DNA polymerase elongation subunit (family B)
MATLIFDIETVGEDFEKMDKITQEMETRWLKKESLSEDEYKQALEELKNGLGFSPLTGQIVAIGILDSEKNEGAVYYQAPGSNIEEIIEDGIKFKPMTEAEMLKKFWQVALKYDEFISFNGRAFDAPFLMIRSAINKIKPSVNLMPNRYAQNSNHIDLLDQLSFFGAVRRKGNLHLWSRAFGIKSPKADGITGDDVSRLFKEKKFLDIAKYNVGDLRATRELYLAWKEFIKF